VFKGDVGDGTHFPRGSAGLAWRRGRGMSGSGEQRDKAGRMWGAGLLALGSDVGWAARFVTAGVVWGVARRRGWRR